MTDYTRAIICIGFGFPAIHQDQKFFPHFKENVICYSASDTWNKKQNRRANVNLSTQSYLYRKDFQHVQNYLCMHVLTLIFILFIFKYFFFLVILGFFLFLFVIVLFFVCFFVCLLGLFLFG